MILNSITLKKFRNYQNQSIVFSDHINVITGPNAQGKTNLLEAVFFLSRGYSHRASTFHELICFDPSYDDMPAYLPENVFYIEGEVIKEDIHHHVSVKYEKQKKITTINGKKEKKQDEVAKILNTILFEPEDLRIVKAGPEKRRNFMDEEISGYNPAYYQILKQYKKILNQRNALLKEVHFNSDMEPLLETWDRQLIEYGSKLIAYRVNYLKRLGPYASRLHNMLSSQKEKLSLFYQNNVLTDLSQIQDLAPLFQQALNHSKEKDIERGSTGIGPHVDDIIIQINGQDARKYCSQGQQRTAAIALKCSQIDIYKESTGDYPIVLLDDVLSELDCARQEKLLSVLGKTQSFITCTDDSFARRYDPERIKILHICKGRLEE